MRKTPEGTRLCHYSSPYGGRWVYGFFHGWTDVKRLDFNGSSKRAIIEDEETGRIHLIAVPNFAFLLEQEETNESIK